MLAKAIGGQAELRLLQPCHSIPLFNLIDSNRDLLRKWLPWVDTTQELADTQQYIRLVLEQFAENRCLHLGIWLHQELAGVIGVTYNWNHRQGSLGYWLGRDFQGQGLMTSACKAVLADSFGERGLNRMEIRCATGNYPSQAIPQRLGFKREGLIREAEWLNHHFVDHIVFGLLVREWINGN